MLTVETLSKTDFARPEFFELMREAAGGEDAAVRNAIETKLPRLRVVGIRDEEAVVAFAAYGPGPDRIVLAYIAVQHEARSAGYGTALIQYVCAQDPAKVLLAETDDDAVTFYRRLGFSVVRAPTDDRWPARQRYRCELPPLLP